MLVANEAGSSPPIADATYASAAWRRPAAAWRCASRAPPPRSTPSDGGRPPAPGAREPLAVAPATGASIERLPGRRPRVVPRHRRQRRPTSSSASVPEPQNLASPPTPGPVRPRHRSRRRCRRRTAHARPVPSDAHADRRATRSIGRRHRRPLGPCSTGPASPSRASRSPAPTSTMAAASWPMPAGGIAVLVDDGAFTRGALLRVTGEIDDRFAQRTLRADWSGRARCSGRAPSRHPGACDGDPLARRPRGSSSHVAATIVGGATTLATGVAFDFDDGSGPTRVIVAAGIGDRRHDLDAPAPRSTLNGVVAAARLVRHRHGGLSRHAARRRPTSSRSQPGSPTPAPTAIAGSSGRSPAASAEPRRHA